MRHLANTISGSIAGSGAVLFVLILGLNIAILKIQDDPITFVLISLILILAYIAILPLVTLIGCLMDNYYRGDFSKALIHYASSTLLGCMIFTFFLFSAIQLSLSDEGGAIFQDSIGIGFKELLLLILATNLGSSVVGAIVNNYRHDHRDINSIDISQFDLAPSTVVELVRDDTPREYFNSLIAGGRSSSEAVIATVSKYPDWNPMHEESP
jgi:hypothetical protein